MEDKTNQPEKTPAPKVRKITPLDLLKRDVKLYRADCMMSVGNDKKCRPCTASFFESILGMIDRIALQEAIARQEAIALQERKTGKWIITARNGVLCSECKSGTRRMPMLLGNPLYKYCPLCGVKMEGVEE